MRAGYTCRYGIQIQIFEELLSSSVQLPTLQPSDNRVPSLQFTVVLLQRKIIRATTGASGALSKKTVEAQEEDAVDAGVVMIGNRIPSLTQGRHGYLTLISRASAHDRQQSLEVICNYNSSDSK